MNTDKLKDYFLEQIRIAATSLPAEVETALKNAHNLEKDKSIAKNVLNEILKNVKLAREQNVPICQDTGTNIFYIYYPFGVREKTIEEAVHNAVIEATKLSYLRPNTVDSLTGKNSGFNIGEKNPQIHFHQWDNDYILSKLMLKGGGSENVSAQYSLPDEKLNAFRDIDGIKKVIIDSIVNAQGMGCAPGILGVGVGGDRLSSFMTAKEQLFRNLFDNNENEEIDKVEKELLVKINQLKIGPMGFGGDTTVLGVKIGFAHRLPASFYVSIAYMCWAYRKAIMTIDNNGVKYEN